MPNITVSVDKDIYDTICAIKERSNVSLSQAGNRLMRAGINYGFLGDEIAEVRTVSESTYALIVELAARLGHGDIVDDVEE